MEIILLEKVHNLGALGDKVRVRAGYGRNYLIPRKKAVPATADNVTKFEAQRAVLERAHAAAHDSAAARGEKLKGLELTVTAKAGTEGRLYGSVGTNEICTALAAAGHTVEKREVRLPLGPLRTLGRHSVDLQLHADITTQVVIVIAVDEAEK
ncbi:MAG: 50S ribosomal protein L9 [Gammaproteobacteria bacterium]|nr:50S ribosomal protein L9 [Gammaproteobacteria bacterium]